MVREHKQAFWSGSASLLTASVSASSLGVAFRAIGMKYETGSGLNRFVYDMIIWGPEVGFLFHF